MNGYPVYVYNPYPAQQYTAQWVQYIVPVLTGMMMLVIIAGMVRDLIKGEKVEMPL